MLCAALVPVATVGGRPRTAIETMATLVAVGQNGHRISVVAGFAWLALSAGLIGRWAVLISVGRLSIRWAVALALCSNGLVLHAAALLRSPVRVSESLALFPAIVAVVAALEFVAMRQRS